MADTLRDRLQAALGSAYDIGAELGGGAMSRVFAATETALGRQVVIKVLPPDCAGDETVERFRREILLSARLRHPHILPVYAAGEAAGYLYYTMPFVVGEPLRRRLDRDGAMPVGEATRILREMASALSFAHRKGVVHRDVKPENIFLEEQGTDRALLADFGVARLLDSQSDLTLTGTAIGTPLYMSPEQVDGAAVDGRTDVYSLGLVGWEMLAGRRPWAGETLYTIIYNQKYEILPPLSHLRADVPRRLQRAIERALAKDRDLRWPTIDAFATALADAPREPGRTRPSADTAVVPYVPHIPSLHAEQDGHRSPRLRQRRWYRPALAGASVVLAAALVGAAELMVSHPRRLAHQAPDTAGRAAAHARPSDNSLLALGTPGTVSPPTAGRGPLTASESASSAGSESATGAARGSPSVAVPVGAAPGPRRTAQVSTGEAPRDRVSEPPAAPGDSTARTAASDSSARVGGRTPDAATDGGAALLGRRGGAAAGTATTMLTHSDSLARCTSPRATDQRTCLVALTSDDDAHVTRTLARLVTALRQRAGVRDGDPDPASVRQLRAEQDAWVAARAAQCARQPQPPGEVRWAPGRAWCLSESATRRADSLDLALRRTAAASH